MLGRNEKKDPQATANKIAKEISRRGVPAKVKLIVVMSPLGDIQKHIIVIPGRGVAAVNGDLNIAVYSSNKPLPQAPVFEYENVETATENILRNLPLP